MEPKPASSLTKAIIISLILIILSLVALFMNLDLSGVYQYLGYVVYLGGVIWGIWYFGKQINYNATFGKYFSHGFAIVAIVTVVMIIFTVIEISAFPDFKNKLLEKSMEKMQSNPNANEEQAKMGFEFFKKHFMLFMVSGTMLSFIFFGTIAALIGAGVTRKNPRPIFEDDIKTIG
ncbi:MAG: DUF4199 domain-containing protein [Chitinophagaceae bacterium]|nr:DUF4199 domain-containing protein [Chitinophagaceae bacterium]